MPTTITPFLWFDKGAEEAAEFYVSLFEDSRVHSVSHHGGEGGEPGPVLVVDFEVAGQRVQAMNAGPQFPQTEAFSFYVECDDQAEVDRLWNAFLEHGGQESMCGWLKDRYGVSWQIIPEALPRMMTDPDAAKAARVMEAMLKMRKIDVAELEAAYAG